MTLRNIAEQTLEIVARGGYESPSGGYVELHAWLLSFGAVEAVGIESTGSYGAGLRRHLAAESVEVIEVNRADRSERRFNGKDDTIDAEATDKLVDALMEAMDCLLEGEAACAIGAATRGTGSSRS